ncbi:alkaline phosphatase [Streptomyces sp. A7024]|uniref:Alkaline phosphatase n=1 Tax=Streptomyces coryli TaxID=1128680 RepID=A0A6G4U3L2_9ACTN|nr:alkaline phosphatase D family protein [Streptomyces coryli]NGN66754.1 alkaline phosphatase [Streptomyces coryli]
MQAIGTDPFTLGVASGDPLPDSVVLWTRLAPEPYRSGGGLPAEAFAVGWELAEDDGFQTLVAQGEVTASPEDNHTVHVEVAGLEAGRPYWYRFRADTWTSPPGRTRTAPPRDSRPARLRFGLASCQAYYHGYFTAFRHLADADLDAVVHLGDYLYEYAVNSKAGDRNYTDRVLPSVFNREAMTLDDYRLRYALYKSDPDLRAAHAAHPFIVTWDDHEVENNYAGPYDQTGSPPEQFLARRAAAYRAFWENMPLRERHRPVGPDMDLYRRLHFGTLAQLDLLDARQYRSDQAYGDGWKRPGPESADPARTMTGEAQERWLLDGWHASDALWNVLAQPVVFARRRDRGDAAYLVNMDAWDGYPASRERLLAGAQEAALDNLVVLGGDVHVHCALDIKRDFDDAASPVMAAELIVTSVSSDRDGADRLPLWDAMQAANPHLRFYNGRRGYVILDLDDQRARADFHTLPYVTAPGAPVTTAASFTIEAGQPGLRPLP